MSDNPRVQAVRALTGIYQKGRTLDQVLTEDTPPLVRELVAGTLRHHFSLSQRVDELLTRPLRSKDTDIRALLLIGAYQLLFTRIPDHAAVAETVECTRALQKPWARGLVNAILRNLPTPTEEWSPAALHDHPHWFINLLRNSLPDHWVDVLQANNTRAPMCLRVNQQQISTADYGVMLTEANIEYRSGPLPETLILQTPRPQHRLPGFADGLVAVQDAAAQLAAALCNPADGARVLDACAAPGGKGFHLLERFPDIHLHMQDNAPARIATLSQQANRLGHQSTEAQLERNKLTIKQADSSATGAAGAWDLILLDAPCSGSGTVRRHPDIKVLRSAADLDELNQTQSALLSALWPQLVPGGRLVYCTCSLFREENDAIISAFLSQHDAIATPVTESLAERLPEHSAVPGIATELGWQTLPVADGGDGLYFCELLKPGSTERADAASDSSEGRA